MPHIPIQARELGQSALRAISALEKVHPHLLTDGKIVSHMIADAGAKAPRAVLKALPDAKFLQSAQRYKGLIHDLAHDRLPPAHLPEAMDAIGHFGDLGFHLPKGGNTNTLHEIAAGHFNFQHTNVMEGQWARGIRKRLPGNVDHSLIDETGASFHKLPRESQAEVIRKGNFGYEERKLMLDPTAATSGTPRGNRESLTDFAKHLHGHHATELGDQAGRLSAALGNTERYFKGSTADFKIPGKEGTFRLPGTTVPLPPR